MTLRSSVLLVLATLTLAQVSGCKTTTNESGLQSGFSGNDCASARSDLAVQAPKLAETKRLFLDKYEAYVAQQGASLMLDDDRETIADGIKSEGDCNTKLLKNAGTDTAESAYQDVYQRCVDYYRVFAVVKAREEKLDTTECKQGADIGTVVPVFISSCDVPCSFTNVECGLVELDANGSKRRFACGTTRAATEAARGYCREFNVPEASCVVGEAILKKGNEIARPMTVVAGENTDRATLSLEAFGAGVASAEYKGGVVVSGEARIEFKAQGVVSLELVNQQRAVRAGEFIAAGTETACKLSITGFANGSTKAFVGAGGAFTVFGNGVEAKAGIEAGLQVSLSRAIESTLGRVQAGGLEASVVLERCVPLAKAWLENNIAGEFKPFADELAKHVDRVKEAAAAAADAAFAALGRGEESVDTKGRIFCETNVSATFSSGNKVYRINTFYASVGAGKVTVKANYEGSINPVTSTTGGFTWDMKGSPRGERILRQIAADGVGALSDDDIRWLLTDVTYSGSNKFADCSRSGF